MKRLGLVLALATFSLIGCVGGGGYYARVPPPPLRYEARGVAPGAGYVWVDGYWGWRGWRHEWVAGRWARPPRSRAVWVNPSWERNGDRYRFHEGHWR